MTTDQPQPGPAPVDPELLRHPERIPGYAYGTPAAARSPLTLDDLDRLKAAVGITPDDERALRVAGELLADRADSLVTAWRAELGRQPYLAAYSAHPDGTPNPEYSAASKPRFDRWIIDACTRPLDASWLDYQHEIGLRHTRAKKNTTDGADSVDHIPLRYLAFTAVVITSVRDVLAASGLPLAEVDAMHAAWTKSVLLHVTVWSRAYLSEENW